MADGFRDSTMIHNVFGWVGQRSSKGIRTVQNVIVVCFWNHLFCQVNHRQVELLLFLRDRRDYCQIFIDSESYYLCQGQSVLKYYLQFENIRTVMPESFIQGQIMSLNNGHNHKNNQEEDDRQDSKDNGNSGQRIL